MNLTDRYGVRLDLPMEVQFTKSFSTHEESFIDEALRLYFRTHQLFRSYVVDPSIATHPLSLIESFPLSVALNFRAYKTYRGVFTRMIRGSHVTSIIRTWEKCLMRLYRDRIVLDFYSPSDSLLCCFVMIPHMPNRKLD